MRSLLTYKNVIIIAIKVTANADRPELGPGRIVDAVLNGPRSVRFVYLVVSTTTSL